MAGLEVNGRLPARRAAVQRVRCDARGAVLIEFALTLPLLLLVLLGICDFGLAFRDYHVVTNAAREGARMAVLPGYTTADVQNRVGSFLDAVKVTPAAPPRVEEGCFNPGGGALSFRTKVVTVQANYAFPLVDPIARTFGRTFGVTFKASSEMRTEVAAAGGC
jgi:Flp pilus assembly protein TadG